ncbi:MAG: DUF4091 domain-containing protein [Clostridia bacterium]|nr:DUF4091 domain-containing protein [Clostridia bacterium]
MLCKNMGKSMVESKIVASVEKIMPHICPSIEEREGSMLKYERYNFQLAFCYQGESRMLMSNKVQVSGTLAPYLELRVVGLVPVTVLPPKMDDYYLSDTVGVFPDLLKPFDKADLVLPCKQWRGVWVTVYAPEGLPVGTHETTFTLISEKGETLAVLKHNLEIIDAPLVDGGLRLTNWVHYDCIAHTHGVRLFSRAFYKIFKEYLRVYTQGGYNMLMTPLFTPPLDTKIGGERLTAQLVRVKKTGEQYTFDFQDLKRFIRFALKNGIKYIEFSPLFTQWGGVACPKIIATVDGEERRIFGWETPSASKEYMRFLDAFLPQLGLVIDELGIRESCYMHLTDEPGIDNIDAYEQCRNMVKRYIGNIPIMDALGNPEFKERGLVDVPVSGITYFDKFAGCDTSKMFVYNCCTAFNNYYSNRFINMPAQRTRVLGVQLYQTGVRGYLHWGFNFYNSAYSVEQISPYSDTDSHGTFPSGDAFIVYPAPNGVYGSLRYEICKEGFQDCNALKLLENYIGKDRVHDMLEKEGVCGYTKYPRDGRWLINFRAKINQMIKEYVVYHKK